MDCDHIWDTCTCGNPDCTRSLCVMCEAIQDRGEQEAIAREVARVLADLYGPWHGGGVGPTDIAKAKATTVTTILQGAGLLATSRTSQNH